MKKTVLTICIIVVAIALIIGAVILGVKFYEEERIKNATIIVDIKDEDIPFDSEVYLSDLIENINGKLIKDFKIDTEKLGKQEISFKYINDEDIKVSYSFNINIIDNVPPIVWLGETYSILTTFKGNLLDKILCADNYDDEPVCTIEGEYNTEVPGNYNLKFIAEDSSQNKTEKPFVLKVSRPSSSGGNTYVPSKFAFNDAKENFKNENAKFGIDVSAWQGEIDYEKVKNAGVEFVFIRIGSRKGIGKEFFVDSKFERNIKGFNEVGIPVGIYFYSYASNEREAKKDAEWVVENLKGYKVDLPIAFDFEDWGSYNKYKMSLHRLNKNAEVFIDTVEKHGYKGMLYGSVNYLGKMWNIDDKTVWVAHYTKNASYKDKYAFWQFSASGKVDGINGDVDLDMMYGEVK